MSSDESTSTQLSVVSSQAGAVQDKLKQHIAEQWEINCIGNFLLSLYHRSLINAQTNWTCKKNDIRKEFAKFANQELRKSFKDLNGTDNIGTLLHRSGFLWNTPRGNPNYKLKSKEIFDFRNKELKARDKCRKYNDDTVSSSDLGNESANEVKSFTGLQVSHEIDEDSPEHMLEYQGTTMQQRRENYYPTNMACCICQMDFPTMDSYEEHIQTHNDEEDFEYLKELSQFDSPIFKMSYRLCKNSHYFCFNYVTNTQNVIIEKIIIVQSRSMFYVHDMRVPYEMPINGSDKFYVDSHLFTLFVEQPVILISHLKDAKDTRIIEEHHFMRSMEFPKVNFAIKPYRLPSKTVFKHLFKLPDYFPPIEIRDALRDDFMYEKLMRTSNEFRDYIRNEKILQPQTIGATLTTLLHVEDMDTIKEYFNLLQQNITLRSCGDSYSFKLRPKQRVSVENILSSFDDIIITTRTNITAESENLIKLILTNQEDIRQSDMYVGRIEDVNSGRVSFKCSKKFDMKRKYTVIFRPGRTTLRHQYRAMELLPVVMPFLKKFLFPGQLIPKSPSIFNLELFDKTIYNNPEQLQAVRNIAEGPRNDATYIIFGPPGTGKTTTLVESILQVLKRDDTKILVTASSNSACDELALRLCKGLKAELDMPRAIVRVYAKSNESRIDNIDDLLIEHSNLYNYVHFYPDIEILHEYRIVVCTMSVVAKLSTGKFGRRGNSGTLYTHLFIDEVAAATEVEALMPITSVLTPKSCLIIAGDNKQLGPILKSKRAEELRLGVSLMDRLLARECYRVNTDTGDYDRSIQSRLRLNFRSHPAIVNLYSAMYYNHDLEAKAKIEDVSLIKDWHLAPSKEYPIIFHCINGNSKSDRNSFSLYNSEEINIVMDYVKDLMYFGINGNEVHESDIGIISPYKKQYMRIREELNLRKWYSIETGSVENFQGREKNIIIVSFVRSGTQTLGFLESPRRLNVTLSRAKSLLILVGNAGTLCINPDFQHIVNECKRHNTLVGKVNNGTSSEVLGSSHRENNSNDKENAMDIVNKSLKDLKLTNHSQQFSKTNSNRANATRRRSKNHKISLGNVGSNNENDGRGDDNKPSTSTAAGIQYSSRTMKKTNSSRTRDTGKVTKAYKGETQNGHHSNTKDNQTSKINLETYFDGLPNVPTSQKTTVKNATNTHQVPTQIFQQNMTPPTQHAQIFPFQQQQQYPYYPMQRHLQQQRPSLLGMPFTAPQDQTSYMSIQQHQQLQHQMQVQQHLQLQQQSLKQQQQFQQRQQQHQHQQKLQQELLQASQATAGVILPDNVSNILTNLNLLNCTTKNGKPQKEHQHGKKKPNQDKDANNRDGVGDATKKDEPKPLTSKTAENLDHSLTMEAKKLHQLNAGKISKPYKSGGSQATKNSNVKKEKITLAATKSTLEAPMTTIPSNVPKAKDAKQNQFYACDKQTLYRPASNKVSSSTNLIHFSSKNVNSTVASSVEGNTSKTPTVVANTNGGTKTPKSVTSTRPTKLDPVKHNSVVTINKDTNGPKIAPTTLLNTCPSSTITNGTSNSGFSIAPITATFNSSTIKNSTATNNSSLLLGPSTSSTSNSSMIKNHTTANNSEFSWRSSTPTTTPLSTGNSNNSPLSLGSSTTTTSSSTVKIYPTSSQATSATASIIGKSLSTNHTTATTSSTQHSSTITNRISSNNSSLSWRSSTPTTTPLSTGKIYPTSLQASGTTASIINQSASANRTTVTTSSTQNFSTITNRTSSNNSPFSLGSSSATTSSSAVKLYPTTSQVIGVTSSINSPSTNRTLSNNYSLQPTNASSTPSLSDTLNRSATSGSQCLTAAKTLTNNHSSSAVKNSTQSSTSSSSLGTSKAPTTSYSTSALNRPAATVEIYPNTSQAVRTNHTSASKSSTSSTTSYNSYEAYSNSSYGEGSEAIHYNHYARPVRNFNYENSSSHSRNSSKSESKCTIA